MVRLVLVLLLLAGACQEPLAATLAERWTDERGGLFTKFKGSI